MEEQDRTLAAILAAGLLAREAAIVSPGDQERVPLAKRAQHAVDLYQECLKALRGSQGGDQDPPRGS